MSGEPEFGPLRMLVGLGNPGGEYELTRHNIGFMVLDRLAAQASATFQRQKNWDALLAKDHEITLLKPQTYMNNSGSAVQKALNFYKFNPQHLLVIYDDLDLPLGTLRIRGSGSAGGHNGMRSLIQHLGTDQFARLRLGIGKTDPRVETINHVLGKFSADERSELEKSLDQAVLAVLHIRKHGLLAAMTEFNRKVEPPKEAE
jgi:PTH1 family peptidyl-tRNA hydrolase